MCSSIVRSRIFCFLSAFAWGRRWLRCSFCKGSFLQRDQLNGSCDGNMTQAEYCLRSQGTVRESCKHGVTMFVVSASLFSHMHACNWALLPDVECATVEMPGPTLESQPGGIPVTSSYGTVEHIRSALAVTWLTDLTQRATQ